MKKEMFRDLKADEIECRPSSVKETGCSLILYKDARVDANILDETVGCMDWQRHHLKDNANCIVSIWDKEKERWVEKEDTGSESNTQKEKGLASDSFKRACFAWGIGRELYTAPFIWIKSADTKDARHDKFKVKSVTIVNKVITSLVLINASLGNKVVFTYGKPKVETAAAKKSTTTKTPNKKPDVIRKDQKEILLKLLADKGLNEKAIQGGIDNLTQARYSEVLEKLNGGKQ